LIPISIVIKHVVRVEKRLANDAWVKKEDSASPGAEP
jgi:hypothetical protein